MTKPNSILFLECYVDVDISISLAYLGDVWEDAKSIYLEEPRSKNKSFQILVNNTGLHCLTLDNSYSWMTAKNVVFSLNVLKPEEEDNAEFNLFVYSQEFTPWHERTVGMSE